MTTSLKATLESGQKQTRPPLIIAMETVESNQESEIAPHRYLLTKWAPGSATRVTATSAWNSYTHNILQNKLIGQQPVLHKWLALRWSPWRVQPQQHTCNLRIFFVYTAKETAVGISCNCEDWVGAPQVWRESRAWLLEYKKVTIMAHRVLKTWIVLQKSSSYLPR